MKKNKIKRKGTNSLKQLIYMTLWKEEPPKKSKRVKTY